MNREIFPGGLYPLQGDVQSQAGNQNATVVGIRGKTVDNVVLIGGEVIEFNPNTNMWEPTIRAAIQVNNVTVSDDYLITVNVPKMVKVNGA